MGGASQFFRALGRKPLPEWPRFQGAGGAQQGLSQGQWESTDSPVPWEVVVLCTSSEDPVGTLYALSTTLDTHDALDLLDIQKVKDSWVDAARANASEQ